MKHFTYLKLSYNLDFLVAAVEKVVLKVLNTECPFILRPRLLEYVWGLLYNWFLLSKCLPKVDIEALLNIYGSSLMKINL